MGPVEKQVQDHGSHPGLPENPTFGDRLDQARGFLRRQYLIVLLFLALAVPVGAAYHYASPATYTASATILIDTRRTVLQDALLGSAAPDPAWLDSQMGILKSLNVAAYVVRQLRLADDPDFVRPDLGPVDRVLGVVDRVLIRLKLKEPPSNPTEAERAAEAIGAVSSQLDVRRLGVTYMMRVDFRNSNPDVATKVANAMVDAYIFEQLNAKYQANRQAGDWLQERLQTLREQAAAAERAVIEFKSKHNIVSAGGTLINDRQLADITGQLAKTRAHADDLQVRLARIEAVRKSYGEQQSSSPDENVSEAMTNPIIAGLRSRYLDLVNREADWSAKYGRNHAAVTNLRNQIREVRKSIRDELGRIEQQFRSEYQIATKRQDELEKALASLISKSTTTNQAQVMLFSLEAQAQSYRKIYDNFLQRHTETVQQQTFPVVEARMLSPATVTKTGPKALQIWLATIFGGGLLGVGCGMLREALDRGFRTREQVRSVLHTDCLALVPRLSLQARRLAAQRSVPMPRMNDVELSTAMRSGRQTPKNVPSTPGIMRSLVDAPYSPYAEAIRSIKLSVDLNSGPGSRNVIGLTSCFPAEGKTTLASAMATIIGQSDARVLLVDCDLRNPSLSRSLTPDAKVGLLDVIVGRASLGDAIWGDPSSNVSFLPTVANGRYTNPAEFLNSEAALALFDSLRTRYDYIIIDLAPLVAALDVRAASSLIGSYVLVVEWGCTKVDAVRYSLRNVPGIQEKMVGVVLNKVDMNSMKYYDSYGAAYLYGQSRQAVH